MRYIVLFTMILCTSSCMTKQQKTFKDELPNLIPKQITQIKITELHDSISKIYATPDSICKTYEILIRSKRRLAKFYPTHTIYLYIGDTSVIELSYRDNFFKYKGISFEMSQKLIVPTIGADL